MGKELATKDADSWTYVVQEISANVKGRKKNTNEITNQFLKNGYE